jgi:regulation of enolase protein 1 (concanavalin A-like superfamily)
MTRTVLFALLIAVPVAAAPLPEHERERLALRERWGNWMPRDLTCSYQATEHRLRIRVSDGIHTRCGPEPSTGDTPHFLREATGDFTAVVRVACPPQDQPNPGRDRWVAGGLIVRVGPMEYVLRRLEGRIEGGTPAVYVISIGDQNDAIHQPYHVKGIPGPTFVRLIRRGDRVTPAWSPDGKAWTDLFPARVKWGPKVRVGIIAESCLGVTAEVTFDAFSLTQSKKSPETTP